MGVIAVGVSPRRELDQEYKGFFELIARRVAAAIAEARAYEAESRRAQALAELHQRGLVHRAELRRLWQIRLPAGEGPA